VNGLFKDEASSHPAGDLERCYLSHEGVNFAVVQTARVLAIAAPVAFRRGVTSQRGSQRRCNRPALKGRCREPVTVREFPVVSNTSNLVRDCGMCFLSG
jgi:hypothetical protein